MSSGKHNPFKQSPSSKHKKPKMPTTSNPSSPKVLDTPKYLIVRPPPSTASIRLQKNDGRVFLNRTTMEQNGVLQDNVVVIRRYTTDAVSAVSAATNTTVLGEEESEHFANEDERLDVQTLIGVAWPMDRIEPEVVRMTPLLRQSAGLQIGDLVKLAPYPFHIEEAKEVRLQQEDTANASTAGESLSFFLREELLQQPRYLSVGMRFECAFRGVLRSFIVKAVVGPGNPEISSMTARLENLSISTSNIPSESLTSKSSPIVFRMSRATTISFTGSDQAHESTSEEKSMNFASIGGLNEQIEILRDMVEMPLLKPHLFIQLGMKPPRGVLLYGPPGTGKTSLLRAIASETQAHVLTVNGPSVLSKYQGETESALRSIFAEAYERQPSIIFIDEIDTLAPKRGGENESALDVTDGRVVATLLTLMDGMTASGRIAVVAATNRPNAIDPALRRPGRFDREIEIPIPDATARLEILRLQLQKMPHVLDDTYVQAVAAKTHGYVGADLIALCTEAGMHRIKLTVRAKLPEDDMKINQSDMEAALLVIRASAMREIFLEPQKVRWSDIGGQEDVKRKLREAVELPLVHPETFQNIGVTPPKGILLYGPPGCSKTLMAKALATETGKNFFAVKGPELFNKYVGESERMIRDVFKKARAASPSIIFFDEIDAMTMSRGEGGGNVNDRILSSLLNEMDGIESLVNVTILAATNRPDVIDSALMRPGRIDRILYVGPPDLPSRAKIFEIEFRTLTVANDVDVMDLATRTEGFSGAELSAVCRDAGMEAICEDVVNAKEVRKAHFDTVLKGRYPRITVEQLAFFEAFTHISGVERC